jgi:hypothetical protein
MRPTSPKEERPRGAREPSPSPIRFMWFVFLGFGVGLAYGLAGAALIYAVSGEADAQEFLKMYISRFNVLATLGLAVGTALMIGSSQHLIPNTIEAAFRDDELGPTDYEENKLKYFSLSRTITFAAELIVLGFMIFHFCHFPLSGLGEALMLVAGCLQWGLASYVGRKIRYAAMMLHSLLEVKVTRNLFKERELDVINTYVQMVSILTIIGAYLGVRSYYNGPFLYDTFLGRSAQVFLLMPAIIAAPVLLIFNFYPREVLRKIYDKSIDIEVQDLHKQMKDEKLSEFEKKLRLMELGKMFREELRYSLQLTLSDLPIGLTIVIMVVEPLLKG